MIKAIETRYKGCRFRSRLEARWAVFFDALHLPWAYEPEGFVLPGGKRYLPDFLVTPVGQPSYWFEVKGRFPTVPELQSIEALATATDTWAFIASGTMDVPVLQSDGVLAGAHILGFAPRSAVVSEPAEAEARQMLHELARSSFKAFYEDEHGDISIDDVYVQELPFVVDGAVGREVHTLHLDGTVRPRLNVGYGRLFRSDRLKRAYEAARSARFEHGESPK